MNPLLKKLNLKEQKEAYLINIPDNLKDLFDNDDTQVKLKRALPRTNKMEFALIFIKSKKEIAEYAKKVNDKIGDDPILWFAYPKKSSKNIKSDVSRDDSWGPIGIHLEMEGVRIIAIDKDWSALRFRRVTHIKKMTRHKGMILSEAGKKKTTGR